MTVHLWDKNRKEIERIKDVLIVAGDKEGNLYLTFYDVPKSRNIESNKYYIYTVAD